MSHHPVRVGARWVWLGVLLVVAGCAPSRTNHQTGPAGTLQAAEAITVIVENHLWNDIVVYSTPSAGAPVRLGTATTGIPKRFRIPSHHDGSTDLHLTADPVGSTQVRRTETIMAVAGQEIRWELHESETVTQLTVRHRR